MLTENTVRKPNSILIPNFSRSCNFLYTFFLHETQLCSYMILPSA